MQVRKVHNLSFDPCTEGRICYGVPLLPEQEERLAAAGEKLSNTIGFPDWLTSIAPMFDGNHAYIEVGVLPGSKHPPLPPAVDGIPVVAVYRERA